MFTSLTCGLIKAGFAVFARVVSQALFEKIITKVSIALLQKLAASTENKLDDHLVKDVISRLQANE